MMLVMDKVKGVRQEWALGCARSPPSPSPIARLDWRPFLKKVEGDEEEGVNTTMSGTSSEGSKKEASE